MGSGRSGKTDTSGSDVSIVDTNDIELDVGILGSDAADRVIIPGASKCFEADMLMMFTGLMRGELEFSSSTISCTGSRTEELSLFLNSLRTSLDSCSFVLGLISRTAKPGAG